MLRLKTNKLAHAFGATALALTLALAGCGQKADDTTDTTEATETEQATESGTDEGATAAVPEPSVEPTAYDDEVVISDDLAPAIEVGKSMAANLDSAEEADLSAYPEAEDAEDEVERTDDAIAESDGETSKDVTGSYRLYTGGIETYVPNSWYIRGTDDGFELMSGDGSVCGCLSAQAKEAGYTYDAAVAASSMPQYLAQNGYTDIEIISFETLQSTSGRLVDSFIQIGCSYQGQRYVFYYEFLESKNYLNTLVLAAPAASWSKNFGEISTIVNSVAFTSGEFI